MKNQAKILFVDDEPFILQSLAMLFELDYEVFTASSGEEALKLIKQHDFKVIISDQRMPGMQGVDLLKEAKLLAPHAMRILLTGYSDLDAVINSVNVGEIFRYVNKPWKSDRLKETVSVACRAFDAMKHATAAQQTTVFVSSKSAPDAVPGAGNHILFADSNEQHLKSFEQLFAPHYKVHTATTSEASLKILKDCPIAVFSSNVHLADTNEVDGSDILSLTKMMYPTLVTILLTETKEATLAIRLINQGQVFRYLIKPFQREALMQAVGEAMNCHAMLRNVPMENKPINLDISPKAITGDMPPEERRKRLNETVARMRQMYGKNTAY
jgi:DNA-binding NtrC family response regulator